MAESEFTGLIGTVGKDDQQKFRALLYALVYKPKSPTTIDSTGTDAERLAAIESILQQIGVAK